MANGQKIVLSAADHFDAALTRAEKQLIASLNMPNKIQRFLDDLPYSNETIYRAPLRVLHEKTCQCFDGAVFAAALLHRIGYPAVILNLIPNRHDNDHVLALFRRKGHWGAIAKSNFAGLRFREPICRNLRELVMSYFEHYYNVCREKTLRGYTRQLYLSAFDSCQWMTRDDTLARIAEQLDEIRRFSLLTASMIRQLSLVDKRSSEAGLLGANRAGLSQPRRIKG